MVNLTETSPNPLVEHVNPEPEELELLFFGAPCQGFFRNVPRKYRFLQDCRNQPVNCFPEYAGYLQPVNQFGLSGANL